MRAKEGDVEQIVLIIRLIAVDSGVALAARTSVIAQPFRGVCDETTEPADISHETSSTRAAIDLAMTDIMTDAVHDTGK